MGFGNQQVLDQWQKDEGYVDSHGNATKKYTKLITTENHDYDTYYNKYIAPQPKPKPNPKHSGWDSFLKDAKKVGSFVNAHRTTILSGA
jgi:hypothetical protein